MMQLSWLIVLVAGSLWVRGALKRRKARRAHDELVNGLIGKHLAAALEARPRDPSSVKLSGPVEIMDGERLYLIVHDGKELAVSERPRGRWWAKFHPQAGSAEGMERAYGRDHPMSERIARAIFLLVGTPDDGPSAEAAAAAEAPS